MADNIRKRMEKKKVSMSSESEVRELLNDSISTSLLKFIQRLQSGDIPIDNMSDLARVYGMYKEINGITEAMEGRAGQSALPEINMKQGKALEDTIQEGKITTDEEGRLDVMDMSTDDVAELIRQFDIAQNKENESAF
ncbi:hypothetical protein CPT_Mater197 [Bacillus phage Mater]|uniref:Uncharacterized protein n=1 Tax=Bacillus phage Mater TaxID=1540090 RepID=A0A0A0RNZ0_9CAUD|nr:terminase small subunit [Bacillus phage Mater]AIW03354.1 hypothetical protein CPT_Mater197 [Bacillus phage Mater]